MSVYMRAVLKEWAAPPFDAVEAHVAEHSDYRVKSIGGRDWEEFEVSDGSGAVVLEGDLWTGSHAREDLAELEERLPEHEGSSDARERVAAHVAAAAAVVGLRVLMSSYDASVAAANLVIEFLERRGGVLTQVDTVGWYDGSDLILSEPDG